MRLTRQGLFVLPVMALLSTFLGTGIFALLEKHSSLPFPLPEILAFGCALSVLWIAGRRLGLLKPDAEQEPYADWRAVRARKWMVALIVYAITLKVIYLDLPNLVPEEAYYWVYAQHPALSYLDHPPLVALGILAGTSLFGNTEFGVRIFTLLCWFLTLFFLAALAGNLHGKKARLPVLLLGCLLPYPFIFGFFATPDAPLMASWAGVLYFAERALLGDRDSRAWGPWLGFGLFTGLGMLAKYTLALLGPSLLLVLLLDRRHRRWFMRPQPYVAVLLALLIFSPVIYWNQQHDWASFSYQSQRRYIEKGGFKLPELLLFILALLTPLGLAAGIEAARTRKGWASDTDLDTSLVTRRRLLILTSVAIPLTVFLIFSISRRTKMSWTGPIWLALLPVFASQLTVSPDKGMLGLSWLRPRLWLPLMTLMAFLYAGSFQYLSIGLPFVPYRQRSVKPVAWRELAQDLDKILDDLEAQEGQEALLIGIDRHFIASEVSFYRRDTAKALRTTRTEHVYGGDGRMYEYWFPERPRSGSLMLFVCFHLDQLQDPRIAQHCDEISPIQEHQVYKRGKPAGRFYYRIGKGYHPETD